MDKAGIEIYSQPLAKVYLNDKEAGMTPYKNNSLKSGEIKVKLVNTLGEKVEKKVKLERNLATVVNYNFSDEGVEDGYVLSMEKSGEETSILVSSQPEKASISVGGEIKGISPMKIRELGEGEKSVLISFPGYKTMAIPVKVTKGYQLIIEAQLTSESKSTAEALSPTPSVSKKRIRIMETGTGWLRVRESNNSAAVEIAKVNSGEIYEYFEEDGEWYQIEREGKKGWVSAKYVEKILE